MDDVYFVFKNKKCTDLGIEISSYPDIVIPEKRKQTISVEGRDGDYSQDDGVYNSYTLDIGCVINGTDPQAANFEEIAEYLQGSGDLILSHDPEKVYTAEIINMIPISDIIWLMPEFTVKFHVQPFRKSITNDFDILETTEKTATLYNNGVTKSLPIIELFGNGAATVSINDVNFQLKNIDGNVIINSEIQEVYKENTENGSRNENYMQPDFPEFQKGKNIVSVSSNVQRMKIKPNWRWF